MSTDVNEEPLKSVIRNCRRLIADAELLLKNGGSAGSACSLAIMAYEEAGKGHSHELEMKKEKRLKIHSQHHFRHLISSMVLMLSLSQKYSLDHPEFTEEQRSAVKARFDAAKSFTEFASNPAPDEIRSLLGKNLMEQIHNLPHDQRIVAIVEMNWLRKLAKSSMRGEVEQLRQKGFYVDFDENGVLNRPMEVTGSDAYKWIWAAKRSVNLLAFGIYYQPYSELASLLESMPKPLPDADGLLELMGDLARRGASEVQSSSTDEAERDEQPYEPYSVRRDP